jgi:glutaredoxin 3
MVSAKESAQAYIDKNPVMVFSKSYCPYCKETKDLLRVKAETIGFKYNVVELDELGGKAPRSREPSDVDFADASAIIEEGDAMQDALKDMDGQRSVPNIYIMKKHIGGNSHIQAKAEDSTLDSLLQQAAEAKSREPSPEPSS